MLTVSRPERVANEAGDVPAAWESLCPDETNVPTSKTLRDCVRQLVDGLRSGRGGSDIPRVLKVPIDGRRYYLRCYRLRHLHMAVRHVWGCSTAAKVGLVTPRIRRKCLARTGGQLHLLVLEDELKGRPVSTWTPQLARDLAGGLAAWHSLSYPRYASMATWVARFALHGFASPSGYAGYFRGILESGGPFSAQEQRVLKTALTWLTDRRLAGESALSHGDLHGGNLLDVGNGRLGWLDLDAIQVRPICYDLATAELGLLRRCPEAIEAFEQAYFVRRPQHRKHWRRYRLQWFALYSLLKWYKLARQPARPGTLIRQRAQAHFARAVAALEVADRKQPSATLIGNIVRRAVEALAVA